MPLFSKTLWKNRRACVQFSWIDPYSLITAGACPPRKKITGSTRRKGDVPMLARLFERCRSRELTRNHGRRPRPSLELLEHRTLLSVYTVDSLGDTGQGSDLAGDLRYCIARATDGDSVQLGVQGTINLTSPLPNLTHSISIDGPGPD